MREAESLRANAEQTLHAFQRNQQIKQAALSPSRQDYSAQLAKLVSELGASDILFTAEARDLHQQDAARREIYEFSLHPRRTTLSVEVAFITFLADHPTFQRTLMVAGRDRHFRVSYVGWGCLPRVVAVIEFTTPTKPPAVSEFDMCAALGWFR